MVGFNRKAGLSRREGGIFGIVKAFVGAVESQKNGTLHMHSILFIAGLPATSEAFRTMCENPLDGAVFRSRFCELVDSVVSTSVQLNRFGIHPSCPSCGQERELKTLDKISKKAFGTWPNYMKPATISCCGACGGEFGATQVVREQVKKLHASLADTGLGNMLLRIGDTHRETDDLTEAQCALPFKPEWPSTLETPADVTWRVHHLRLSRVALLTQEHNQESC